MADRQRATCAATGCTRRVRDRTTETRLGLCQACYLIVRTDRESPLDLTGLGAWVTGPGGVRVWREWPTAITRTRQEDTAC